MDMLLVGDEAAATWLQSLLKRPDLNLQVASTFEAAKAQLNRPDGKKPDLILAALEINQQLFDFIQAAPAPCIAVLATMDYAKLTELRKSGAAGYVLRSSNAQELFFRLQNVLHRAEGSRKNERVIAKVPVEYRAEGQNFKATTYSLSREGVYIATETPAATNTELYVRFQLPGGGPPLALQGKVSYVVKADAEKTASYPAGMAVVFVNITPQDQTRIDQYIASLENKGS